MNRDTAALIIGGYSATEIDITNHVELFGCSGSASLSIEVAPLPDLTMAPGGIKLANEDRVLVCGGFRVNPNNDTDARTEDVCHTWNPVDNIWTQDSRMLTDKWFIKLINLLDRNDPAAEVKQPVTFGYEVMTEMYDLDGKTWSNYGDVPSPQQWYSAACLIEYNNAIYYISNETMR